MIYFDVDGGFQTDVNDIDGELRTDAIDADGTTFQTDAGTSEILISADNAVYESHSDAMLVLSVLQLFVLMVIAIFTIVRRANND